jgi:hypothetical protein
MTPIHRARRSAASKGFRCIRVLFPPNVVIAGPVPENGKRLDIAGGAERVPENPDLPLRPNCVMSIDKTKSDRKSFSLVL